jgi:hypothetical protein
MTSTFGAEHERLHAADSGQQPWRDRGPYVAERAWGTVRDTGAFVDDRYWDRLVRILTTMLSEDEFLSPYGLRALSRHHRDEPFSIDLDGRPYTVDYEPAESATGLFGGNSNWRGPIWFPVNYLIIKAIRRFARFYGGDLIVEHPTGSGNKVTLSQLADDLGRRLVAVFTDDEAGCRPGFGDVELFQTDHAWHDLMPFHEYFHDDTGRGLGASHQTVWTGLVADFILYVGTDHDA